MDRRERSETTRQRIRRLLEAEPRNAKDLAVELETEPVTVLDHIEHVARSLESADSELLVAPPTCRECGFDGFDDPVNHPSRCPECRNERIEPPTFTIQ
ncbi:MAG: transcriptional regulator [Halobacteriales archaeon]